MTFSGGSVLIELGEKLIHFKNTWNNHSLKIESLKKTPKKKNASPGSGSGGDGVGIEFYR